MSRGDSIALVMESRVEYVGTWLGLSKAGYVTALVNTNLRGDILVHSINVADCKAVIFSSEFKEGISNFHEEKHFVIPLIPREKSSMKKLQPSAR